MSALSVDAVLSGARIVPVAVVESVDAARRLGDALVRGGLPIVEVTLRTSAALDALVALCDAGSLTVGAGTVVSAAQVDAVVAAGARFIVSPGLRPAVVERALELGTVVLPGVATPSEIMHALELGLRHVKLFPAQTLGGLAALRALAAPFPELRFVPTGGITLDTAPEYLAHPAVSAVGGSWMVAPNLVREGRFDEIASLAASAAELSASMKKTR